MIEVAVEAVKKAGQITSTYFSQVQKVSYKHLDREVVSEVDIKAESAIKETVKSRFPDHGFLGEETGRDSQKSEYVWIADPIDGTVNYSRGLKKYGISLALSKNREVILGVVFNPISGEMFTAERDKKAYLNGEPIHVNKNVDLFQAVVYASEFSRSKEVIKGLFDSVKNLRIASSSAYDTCMVACGRTEAFIKVTTHPWGFAAANLIVEEAGGKVTNLDGTPWNTDSTIMLISNGVLHDQLLSLLRR
ncbi:MAG: inositol monophosphatase [Candidatus Kerfeldbacteria bacterium]|nr:inositol monophosphatase [Candidatus Kerfeldbacteria bacterium]